MEQSYYFAANGCKIPFAAKLFQNYFAANAFFVPLRHTYATIVMEIIERGEGNPQLATLLTILETLGLEADIHVKSMKIEN